MSDFNVSVRLCADGQGLVKETRAASSELDRLKGATAGAGKAARTTGREFTTVGVNAKSLGGVTQSLSRGFFNLRNATVRSGVLKAARDIKETTVEFRGFDQALKVVTGSSAGAAREMVFIRETADRLGLVNRDLAQSFVQLAGSASGTALAGQGVRDIFEAFTQAGVAFQRSNAEISDGFAAISQIASKGVVSMEALHGQLAEALPGAVQISARAMGMTVQAFQKAVANGEILSDVFLPRLAAQLRKEIPEGVISMNEALRRGGLETFEVQKKIEGLTEAQKDLAKMGLRNKISEQTEALSKLHKTLSKRLPVVSGVFGLDEAALAARIASDELKVAFKSGEISAAKLFSELENLGFNATGILGRLSEDASHVDALTAALNKARGEFAVLNGEWLVGPFADPEVAQGLKPVQSAAASTVSNADLEGLESLRRKIEDFAASADPARQRALELARTLSEIDKAASAGVDSGLVASARAAVEETLKPVSGADFIDQANAGLERQQILLGQSNRERVVGEELERRLADATERGVILTEKEVGRLTEIVALEFDAAAAAEKRVEAGKQATEEFNRIFETARENVQRALADSFNDLLGGQIKGVKSFWKEFQSIGRRAIAETLAELAFRGGKIPEGSSLGPLAHGILAGFGVGGKENKPKEGSAAAGIADSIASAREALGPITKGFKDTFKPLFEKFGGSISGVLGKAFGGSQVGGMLGVFGNKGQTGAQIGGALGSFLPIPGGSVIGSIAGKILGGLFGSTPKSAATISTGDGDLAVSESFGKGAGTEKQAVDLAGSVIGAIEKIAEALDGSIVDGLNLGSIGTRKKKFTFDPSGQNRTKGSGVQTFASEAEAAEAALRSALAKGAVEGLSAAVKRALSSSSDLDKAVKTALRVQDLETLLAGTGSPFKSAFKAFEHEAKERLKVARQFGFDIVRLEKVNADQRQQLIAEQLEAATGPVKRLLDELAFGNQAEGSLAERRVTLVAEQKRLAEQAAAGDTSVLDRLSQVSSQLIDVSKEAFGSTGAFANDRGSTTDLLQQLLSDAETRIREASEAAQKDAGTDKTEAQLSEANQSLDDLVLNGQRTLNALKSLGASLGSGMPGAGGGFAAGHDQRTSVRVF